MKLIIHLAPILILALFFNSCDSDTKDFTPTESKSIAIISSPTKSIDHNQEYRYSVETRLTEGDTTIYSVSHPSWLSFDYESGELSGIPDWGNENKSFNIRIEASNEVERVSQLFSIKVNLGEIICNSFFGDPDESDYILPYDVGESFLVNQSYCPSNPAWGHSNWFAYDFEMPIGTKVLAMRGGEVIALVESFEDGTRICGQENLILIQQDDGSVASYYHMTKNGVSVSPGQKVQQGDLIGFSGDSGCSIGPHLHVAVFRERGKHSRQYTLPINFRNAKGQLDSNNGLIYNRTYEALPY